MPAESMTVNQNFRVTATMQESIRNTPAELGRSDSAYLRACVWFGEQLFIRHPSLVDLNRAELGELAARISQAIVIHPATVDFLPQGDARK